MTPTPEQNAKRVPTPRTDANTFIAGHQDWEGECVTAEFARTLETELQQLRLAADGMREEVEKAPHASACSFWPAYHDSKPGRCDCWKSRATAAYRAAGEGK